MVGLLFLLRCGDGVAFWLLNAEVVQHESMLKMLWKENAVCQDVHLKLDGEVFLRKAAQRPDWSVWPD